MESEKKWNAAIQSQDVAGMSQFLADSYFLAVATGGHPLQVFPRERWLENLKSNNGTHPTRDTTALIYSNLWAGG